MGIWIFKQFRNAELHILNSVGSSLEKLAFGNHWWQSELLLELNPIINPDLVT